MKASKRVEEILFLPSMAARVLLFNNHVMSLMMHKARLVPVSCEAAHVVTRALQRATKAPWQSMPNEFLINAKRESRHMICGSGHVLHRSRSHCGRRFWG